RLILKKKSKLSQESQEPKLVAAISSQPAFSRYVVEVLHRLANLRPRGVQDRWQRIGTSLEKT
ncbi:MAG TPA: hypothetical protein VG122_15975, partial [Gemmata sp.]|nr:hypothetical protein [Gemmata sp.]